MKKLQEVLNYIDNRYGETIASFAPFILILLLFILFGSYLANIYKHERILTKKMEMELLNSCIKNTQQISDCNDLIDSWQQYTD